MITGSEAVCTHCCHQFNTAKAENDWGGLTDTEFWGSHSTEEGKGVRYLASGRQYGNALLGVRHQEEEVVRNNDVIGKTQQHNFYWT